MKEPYFTIELSDGMIVIFIAIAFGLFVLGAKCGHNIWEAYSVENHHGEYYLDAENQKQWRWKTNCGGGK